MFFGDETTPELQKYQDQRQAHLFPPQILLSLLK